MTGDPHRTFRDEDEGLLSIAVAHYEASCAAEKALPERCARAEQRVRELEDQLARERGANTALRMEIEAWRANDEGRAARLREACETTVREMERYYRNGSHPDLSPVLKASKDALAADREGR